jgi:hypothetical protein
MSGAITNGKNLARLLLAGVLTLGVAGVTLAQRTPTGPPAGAGPPANNNPNLDDRQRRFDESRLRSAEMDAGADEANEKRLQAAITNMKEDFRRIQIVRNDIARDLLARKPLDYELVAKQVSEINQRASQLSVYMRARIVEDSQQTNTAESKSEDMIGSLVRLCKLIDSFTENPVLKNAATVDSKEVEKSKEEKAKADRDLLAIVKLSSNIQKESENLKTPR